VKSKQVAEVMKKVDRGNYAQYLPYEDVPQLIGHSQTISAPHMHAYALEHLLPALTQGKASILDVGCGSGYLTVAMARFRPDSHVYGIDNVPALIELSLKNAAKAVR
jgi:protein-L-isoaspartate(D-aspartate) O-methyltransferase